MSEMALEVNLVNDTEFNDSKGTPISEIETSKEYLIKDIVSVDDELVSFLFTLGCYKGEPITVISSFGNNFVISIKDARYSIDLDLAEAILV